MEFAEAVAALDARTNYERTGRLVAPTLDRIAELVDMLDHPERGYPVIHVTGTNGKTTTARAATEVLRAVGLKVATYTSPHVMSVRERFTYDGEPISDGEFVEAWRELGPYLDYFDSQGKTITWFEAATALAFVWFADKAVEAAVIEVGMGGSWDATNVVDADVAAFTEIGGDHPELGDGPEEVAREKAGIIKAGTSGVSLEQSPEVRAVLDAAGPVSYEPVAFALEKVVQAVGGLSVVVRLGDRVIDDVFIPVFGEHLARDALLGTVAAQVLLGEELSGSVIRAGLADVRVPGRMEVVGRKPLVVLDGAHNPPGARALTVALHRSFTWNRLRLVVSVMGDKDVAGVLEPLVAIADEVIVTRNNSPRAAPVLDLEKVARDLGAEVTIVPEVAEAVQTALARSDESDAVLVAGSIYTVGDARQALLK